MPRRGCALDTARDGPRAVARPEVLCRRCRPAAPQGGCVGRRSPRWKSRRLRRSCSALDWLPPEPLEPVRAIGSATGPFDWILAPLRAQGYAVIRFSSEEFKLAETLFLRSREFFSQSMKYKETFKFYPVPGGYLTPFPGSYELFELRRGLPRCPVELTGEAMHAFRFVEKIALGVCAAIGRDIGVDLMSKVSEEGPTLRCIHYDEPHKNRGAGDAYAPPGRAPDVGEIVRVVGLHGADRVLNGLKCPVVDADRTGVSIDISSAPEAVQATRATSTIHVPLANLRVISPDASGVYPEHADSSFVTVMPRSLLAGMEAKDIRTGEWFLAEESLEPNECMVFVGDPMDYATKHRYCALMHRARISSIATSRISMPFFLYPRSEAVLDPPGLPRLLFDHVQHNEGSCRDRFPWKLQTCYFSDMIYSKPEPR